MSFAFFGFVSIPDAGRISTLAAGLSQRHAELKPSSPRPPAGAFFGTLKGNLMKSKTTNIHSNVRRPIQPSSITHQLLTQIAAETAKRLRRKSDSAAAVKASVQTKQ